MKRQLRLPLLLVVLFTVLMSLPFLVNGLGWTALVGLVPLLCLERIASQTGMRRFWWWHYGAFVVWNAVTTFWVCNATVGGGIFAVLANSLQMSLVFGAFRWVKRRQGGVLPYLFLAAAWIAWERWYLTLSQISWPWLVLGNAFAGTPGLVQWYEYTGTLGGSLWVWAVNLALFGLMVAFSDGSWGRWNGKARVAAIAASVLVLFAPMAASAVIWNRCGTDGEKLEVVIAQPNIDPYNKFGGMTQAQQNAILCEQFEEALDGRDTLSPVLLLAPETFTADIVTNAIPESATYQSFLSFLQAHPAANLLFGASTWEYFPGPARPSVTARRLRDGRWVESHNSALILDGTGRCDLFHKSKLVVGVEQTPYPAFFTKIDDMLGGVMGRCVGQKEISLLPVRAAGRDIPVGCAVCYESVYGEYCTGYVRKGARVLTVITNDAWWGDTPGYRQHLNYSRLRAIETRRDIARCANTGISAFIDRRGTVRSRTAWWTPATLEGSVTLSDTQTFFVRHGDIPGRLCVLVAVLLLLAALFRARKK